MQSSALRPQFRTLHLQSTMTFHCLPPSPLRWQFVASHSMYLLPRSLPRHCTRIFLCCLPVPPVLHSLPPVFQPLLPLLLPALLLLPPLSSLQKPLVFPLSPLQPVRPVPARSHMR